MQCKITILSKKNYQKFKNFESYVIEIYTLYHVDWPTDWAFSSRKYRTWPIRRLVNFLTMLVRCQKMSYSAINNIPKRRPWMRILRSWHMELYQQKISSLSLLFSVLLNIKSASFFFPFTFIPFDFSHPLLCIWPKFLQSPSKVKYF